LGAFSAKLMAMRSSEASDILFDAVDRAKQDIEKRRKPS
jgi:hypothetical protein